MRRSTVLIAGIALLVASAAYSGEGNVRRNTRHIPGRYIVVFDASANAASVLNTVSNAQVRRTYQKGFKGVAVDLSDADAQTLAKDPRVQWVEEDATVSVSTTWSLDRIDQRALPLDGSFSSDLTGAGVTVYVVDTGIYAQHTDFGGRVAAGFSSISDNNGSSDCNGHGTHVAGVIGGSTYGVAKSASLVPVRVLGCDGSGSISSLIAGLEWVMQDHALSGTPAVVNMSLGGNASSALDTEVQNVIASGMATIVAAGNDNGDACMTSPARVGSAITVGASTETDQKASFSNYGPCIDVFAPGTNIVSDWITNDSATAMSSGTSSATPYVTGVAALTLQQYPNASPGAVAETLLANATTGAVGGLPDGTDNRLLFSQVGPFVDATSGDGQLLNDPGFDYGETFWASDICSVINPTGCGPSLEMFSAPSHSKGSHAAFGGKQGSFHVNSESLTVPSNVSRAQLSIYLWISSKNKKTAPSDRDVFTVEIRDNNGNLLQTIGTYSNLDKSDTYVQRTFDLSGYKGATVRIGFTGVQNQGPPTWFLLDDVTVNIWR